MPDDQNASSASSNILSSWIETSTDFWGAMLKAWATSPIDQEGLKTPEGGNKSRTQESLESVLKTWQTLSSVARDPGAMDALSNVTQAMPDILRKMVQSSWQSLFHIQQQWFKKIGRIDQSAKAYSFEHLEKNTFKAWAEIYESEFSQFFNIPQLGLTRLYQEKLNRAVDNGNRFQSAFAEFMHLFYLPMEKSFKVLQDELAKMAKDGNLADDYNSYYRLWIKILEGHYMNLFKSPEYSLALGETLATLEEFLKSRDAVIQDILKGLSIPTQKDMDDLYKEVYQLKRKIRKLEKEH